jgi:hypothetical protein
MRKILLPAALAAVLAATYTGVALAAKDVIIPLPVLELRIDGSSGLTPKALSKSEYTPVALTVAGSIRDPSRAKPPPLEEVQIDAQNVAVTTKGFPTCSGGSRDALSTEEAKRACPDSIVGSGSMAVSVQFPEGGTPIPATSPLLIFNGGTLNGTTTLYIHAYLTQPITTAVVATVKIVKAGTGIKSVTTIPKIVNGAVSVTNLSLRIDKKYTYRGKKVSVVGAKCIGGETQADVTTKFYDGSQLSADVLRTCTSKP